MKILAIASITPVPGVLEENDVIVKFYARLREYYPEVHVTILRPALYSTELMGHMRGSWRKYYEICRADRFELYGMATLVVPYVFLTTASAVFHGLNRLAWPMNKRRIVDFTCGINNDLIHAHRICVDGELARDISNFSGKPYIVSTQREEDRFRNAIERACTRKIVEDAACVTSLSPYAAERIEEHTGVRAQVIPYGIEDHFLQNQPTEPKPVPRKVRFITVCRLVKLKNIDVVLESLGKLHGDYDFAFTIVGDGPERKALEALTHTLGLEKRVCFAGYMDRRRIQDMLLAHDVFVMASAPETYGLVYAEAMAAGLPIICSRSHGFHGHFAEEREGFSVQPGDVIDLKRTLQALLGRTGAGASDVEKRLRACDELQLASLL